MTTQKYRFNLDLQLFAGEDEVLTAMKSSFTSLKGILDEQGRRITDIEVKAGRPNFNGSSSSESIGSQFVKSDSYKRFISTGQSTSDKVEMNRKDLTSSMTTRTTYDPSIASQTGSMPLVVRDLIPSRMIDTNSVIWMSHDDTVNNAAFVAEKALKPESTITLSEQSSPVLTLAHWIQASNQALADINGIVDLIDRELVGGLRQVEESNFLYGAGTTGTMGGIMTNAGIQTGETTTGALIDRIRRAITQVALVGGNPSGIVLHPYTFEEIELSKDVDGRYLFLDATVGAEKRLFRVPVIVTPQMTEPEFLVGDFTGATIYDRETISVQVSESHSDFFTKNLKAIRAESRLAFAVRRPKLFVKGTTV